MINEEEWERARDIRLIIHVLYYFDGGEVPRALSLNSAYNNLNCRPSESFPKFSITTATANKFRLSINVPRRVTLLGN